MSSTLRRGVRGWVAQPAGVAQRLGAMGVVVLMTVTAALIMGGCSKKNQLESVARDWCMTIRASQIIPVYPLTEDIQPGDIFLVQTPVDKQAKLYEKQGFLPLDNHIDRLNPSGYLAFYGHSFLSGQSKPLLPAEWIRPATGASWQNAPNAAFPTYSFSVRRGAGLNLAVPVSGVPVGLSLMGADAADGTITILKTRSIGVDTVSMYRQLQRWSEQNSDFLRYFEPKNGQRSNYLRVITRVYSTGKLDVLLNNASSFVGGADVGVPRPVEIPKVEAPTGNEDVKAKAIQTYADSIAKLNAMLAESQTPTRESGSNDDLDPNATDAKTKAKIEELEKNRKKLQEEYDAKKAEADKLKGTAAPKNEELEKAHKALTDAEKKLAEAADDAAKEQAKNDIAKAKEEVETKAAAATEANNAAAAAVGRVEVARSLLGKAAALAPGGSVRITVASSRSVSWQQDFNPPLVLGYLAFDVEIGAGGKLGRPIPTYARLEPKYGVQGASAEDLVHGLYGSNQGVTAAVITVLQQRQATGDQEAADILVQLNRLDTQFAGGQPKAYSKKRGVQLYTLLEQVQPGAAAGASAYEHFKGYFANVEASISAIDEALSKIAFQIETSSGIRDATNQDRAALTKYRDELSAKLDDPARRAAHDAAAIRAGSYYASLIIRGEVKP